MQPHTSEQTVELVVGNHFYVESGYFFYVTFFRNSKLVLFGYSITVF